MPTEKARFTVIVEDELLKKIDDYRFENRYGSRSSAAGELIKIAMQTLEGKAIDEQKSKPMLSEQEEALLSLYRQLDQRRQEEVMDFTSFKIGQNKNTPPPRAPTDEEIEIVKANINKPFGLFYFFVLYTGCRRGEALAIQFKDIDRKNKVIHITKSVYYEGCTPKIKKPKTKAGERTVPLLDILADKLPKGKPDHFLFGGDSPLRKANMQDGIRSYKKKTGLNISPHYLRHGYATILFEAGIDVKTAQSLLGHSDFQTTMNVYTHMSAEHAQKGGEKLNDFLKTTQNNGFS